MKKGIFYTVISFSLISCGVKQQYSVSNIDGERILVTETNKPDIAMMELVEKYKIRLDKEMNVVIGTSLQDMPFDRPESLLTNLTSDVMMLLDTKYTGGEKIDLSLMNVHGHRAPLPKGDITVGDVFETYSFDNELVVVKLRGEYLNEVFKSYANMGGSGVSSNVKLIITKDGKLVDALVKGNLIEDERIYTIVTLDYLAEGNDGMGALKKAVSIEKTGIILRDYMMDYVKQQTKEGKPISSKLDERITIQ